MTLTELSEMVASAEGLKAGVSIAQIKEIQRILLRYLKSLSLIELADLLKRVK